MSNTNSPYIHSYETHNLLEQQESIINALHCEIDTLRRKDWQNEREISQLRMNEMKFDQEIQYLKLSLLTVINQLSKTQPTTSLQLNKIAIDSGISIEETVTKGILHGDYQIGLKYDSADNGDNLTDKDPWCDMFLL